MNRIDPTPFRSSVPVDADARGKLVGALDTSLAGALDGFLMSKQAHWTLRGPFFFARHELFDQVAEHLEAQSDNLAERIGTLGGYPHGTLRMAGKNTPLDQMPEGETDGTKLIRLLVDRLAAYATQLRDGIALSQKVEDAATEDLFTEAVREIELDMWFLESHLDNEA